MKCFSYINFHFKPGVSFHLELWQGSESTCKAFIGCTLALDLGSLSSCSKEVLETSSVSQGMSRSSNTMLLSLEKVLQF